MLTAPNDLFVLYMPRDNTKVKLFHHLTRDGGEVNQSIVTQVLLALFEDRINISFPQSLGTSPDAHGLPKMMESGLAMASTSSLSTCGCIPSGPMDLWMSTLLNQSLTQPLLTQANSSFILTSSGASVVQGSSGEPYRQRQRRHSVTPPFLHLLSPGHPLHSSVGLHCL